MTYDADIGKLSDDTQAAVLSAYEAFEAGLLSRSEFEELAAGIIATGVAVGGTVAALALNRTVEGVTGALAPIAAPALIDHRARLTLGVETIVKYPNPVVRLARIVRAEIHRAGTEGWAEVIKTNPLIEGWTRGLNAGACAACVSMADGRIWPSDHRMPAHTGCACHPVPKIRDYSVAESVTVER